ncbi:ABC transporter permease, partial [Candidatus Bipolaricaulota bacterium]|nr:ABC transporter permease [Candidatus Bipolaricaulota bacterium]
MTSRWMRIVAPLMLLLLLLGAWELFVRWFDVQPFILPAPSQVLVAFVANFTMLVRHGAVTFSEITLGLLLGGVGGILLAVVVFYSPILDKALYPLIIGSQMIPVFAIAPILIVWMGYGLWPKVTVAALISFFPLVVNVSDGLREPTEGAVDLFRSLGATRAQIFWKLRLPASLPTLFSGLKVSATLAVVGATIGEWVGSHEGVGYLMLQSNARM